MSFLQKKYEFTKMILIGINYKIRRRWKNVKIKSRCNTWGVSTEREVSLKTGSEIVANLNRDKYEVLIL